MAKSCLATSRKTSKTTKEKKPWYDHTCRQLKKQLQQLVKKINPQFSPVTTTRLFVLQKKCKKHVKIMHKRYKKQIVNEINALHHKRSQDFWRYINQLRKSDAVEEESYVSSEDWICHYQKLLYRNRTPFSTFQMKILTWKTKIHRITTF